MAKYSVTVRRVVREDTVVEVEAGSTEEAMEKAKLEATDAEHWECGDCEYHTEKDDVKPVGGLTLYSIDLKVCATAYIKASSEHEAKRILLSKIGDKPGSEGEDDIRDAIEDDQFQAPELSGYSLSPAMTYHGTWGGKFDFEVMAKNVPPPEQEG